jgi:hypothetical protein
MQITPLGNEICPWVKVGDINVFFALITDLKSVLIYHLNLPRKRRIRLESACGSQAYRRGQADNPKQRAYLSLSEL